MFSDQSRESGIARDLNETPLGASLTLTSQQTATLSDTKQRLENLGSLLRALLMFGIAYALAFRYGSQFSENTPAPLWFPDSVLLCAFLLTPRRHWRWFLLVGAPIRLINATVPLWFLAAAYLNDGLKAILSAYLLQRIIHGPVRLNTLRQFGTYMATAVVGIPLLSALVGAATRLPLGDLFWRAFYRWFLGDATAALVLTPTLLYWCLHGLHVVKVRAGLFLPLISVLGVCLYLTFFLPHSEYSPIVLYAPLPLLILAATTLPPVGVSTAISSLALVSIVSAVEGKGAFFMVESEHRVLAMQLFLIVISVPMLFVAILIEQQKTAESELSHNQATLRENYRLIQDLAGKLLRAQEEERRRIARELHDDIGQRLAMVSMGLGQLKVELPAGLENESNSANDLTEEVHSIAMDIQDISRQLHSSSLETLGLEATLKNLCLSIARQHQIAVQFQSCAVKGLPADVNLCLFRVAQEALNNAVRHGKAKEIDLSLQMAGNSLSMKVIDDGEGFDPTTLSSGLGLMSMQERVRFLGGKVSVESRPGAGTQVRAELPLPKSA